MSSSEPSLNGLSKELAKFGLTSQQARVYCALVSLGKAKASHVAKVARVYRVDVYGVLRELEELELVEVALGKTNQFMPVPPIMALKLLQRRIAGEAEALQKKIESLLLILEELKPSFGNENEDTEPYKLYTGRLRFNQIVQEIVRNSTKELVRIKSANDFKRSIQCGLFEDYKECSVRGVSVKLVTKITPENRAEIKRLIPFAEIRHSNDAQMRFLVSDGRIAVLSTSYQDEDLSLDSSSDSFLVVNERRFATNMLFLFKHLWRNCKLTPTAITQL